MDRMVVWVDRTFTGLVGPDPTAFAGGLAVLLSLALGAAHALLPGHGKTLIAAYLAGRRGTRRDALLVGTSVTVMHTAAVLVVGLLLYAFASLLGEAVIGWLAAFSGLLVSAIGITLLRSAVLARRAVAVGAAEPALVGATHRHGHGLDTSEPLATGWTGPRCWGWEWPRVWCPVHRPWSCCLPRSGSARRGSGATRTRLRHRHGWHPHRGWAAVGPRPGSTPATDRHRAGRAMGDPHGGPHSRIHCWTGARRRAWSDSSRNRRHLLSS